VKFYNIGYEQFIDEAKRRSPKVIYFDRHWNRVHFWFDEIAMTLRYASDIVKAFYDLADRYQIIGVDLYHSDSIKDI
jgi:hypothetical protein